MHPYKTKPQLSGAAARHSASQQKSMLVEKEAAAYCNVSIDTFRRWNARGVGPDHVAYPGHRRRYYTQAALDEFIAQHTRRRSAPATGRDR